MLVILQFDAASVAVLNRLVEHDKLPTVARLRERGIWHDLDAPATEFAAGAQHTLYSGVAVEDHGLFYPFQWSPAEQRVRYMRAFEAPPPVWEQLGARARTLAVDPYESRPPARPPAGTLVCGWQLHDRVVLQRWASPPHAHARLERLFGAPEPVDEVFGRHHADEMLGLRRRLLAAPARVADAATVLLHEHDFDLAWLTFCAAHVAGHQFWNLSQIDPKGLDDTTTRTLDSTLDDVYVAIDTSIDRILGELPADADVMLTSPVGMDANSSLADLLPEMLRAILDPQVADRRRGSGTIWKLRALLPVGLRAQVARVLPERMALDVTARLETSGFDWSTTRAFAHPAENQGYVRLNLRGRERDGIVAPEAADALLDEIATGLHTFHDFDGHPAVASVTKVAASFGAGRRAELLPDLVVRWTDRDATSVAGVRSERFGVVRRHGVGSGRSGNHTNGDAWALVVSGRSRHAELRRPPRLEDVAATAVALGGGDPTAMVGEPLLEPAR